MKIKGDIMNFLNSLKKWKTNLLFLIFGFLIVFCFIILLLIHHLNTIKMNNMDAIPVKNTDFSIYKK